jgi:hypothetical protein
MSHRLKNIHIYEEFRSDMDYPAKPLIEKEDDTSVTMNVSSFDECNLEKSR